MGAQTPSQVKTGLFPCHSPLIRSRPGWLFCALFAAGCLLGESPAGKERAETAFLAARAGFATNRVGTDMGWKVGKAAFQWADVQTRDADRAKIAEEGIAACRSVLSNSPASAPANYYLALCLGQLAQTKKLGALKLVSQMEASLGVALSLDPLIDHAGPDRGLGQLYHEAPGWPTSVGNKSKSRQHFERAVVLDPDYPDNRLSFAEALWHWRDKEGARTQCVALDALWDRAHAALSGPEWEGPWSDWEVRRRALWLHFPKDGPDSPSAKTRGGRGP